MKKISLLGLVLGFLQILSAQSGPGFADSTFSQNGLKIVDLGTQGDRCNTSILGSDGRLWLGGYSTNSTADMTMIRLNKDGALDNTFKNNGVGTFDYAPEGGEYFKAFYSGKDGSIFGVGIIAGLDNPDVIVVKMNAKGVLDASFGKDGHAIFDILGGTDEAIKIIEDTEGRLVILGNTINQGYDMFLLRLNTDGTVDSSFNKDGIVILDPFGYDNYAADLSERPAGGYYVFGTSSGNGKIFGSIMSVSKNGNFNIDLGGPGSMGFQVGSYKTGINAGKFYNQSLLISGSFIGDEDNQDGFIARIGLDGKLNESFNLTGIVEIKLSPANQADEIFRTMEIASDSSIFLGGIANDGETKMLVAKYGMNGIRDPFFGNLNGRLFSAFPEANATGFELTSSVLDEENQRFYLTGTANMSNGTVLDYFAYAIRTGLTKDTSTSTSIKSIAIQTFSIFPNPSKGTLNLKSSDLIGYSALIFNVQGQLVQSIQIEESFILMNQDLQNGIYFVRVVRPEGIYQSKISLQR